MAKSEIISSELARTYFKALLENAAGLVEDADLLASSSPARARSLLILAMEECAKASRLNETASETWSLKGPSVRLDEDFLNAERWHHPKLVNAAQSATQLGPFWGDYSAWDLPADVDLSGHFAGLFSALTDAASQSNKEKQAGFYVDRDGDKICSPNGQAVNDIGDMMAEVAGVAEMILIRDHSRMKMAMSADSYDSTHKLQQRFLKYAHPGLGQ